ncbi:unnamed protein product [Effrenium voratum]|nr:unnamed protein product [Effrenium voratum]
MLGLWRTFFLCTDWSLGGWDSGWDWLVQSCHLYVLVSLPQYGISQARCLEMRPHLAIDMNFTLSGNAALQPVASNSVPLSPTQSPARSFCLRLPGTSFSRTSRPNFSCSCARP